MEKDTTKSPIFTIWLVFVVGLSFALIIGFAINSVNFAKTCDECGKIIFGKGYYSTDALWKSNGAEITLCKSCAAEDWAPFDYKSHAK